MKRLFLAGILLLAAAHMLTNAMADTRGPVQRVVSGRVLSESDAPVKDAVVYLKDTRTLAVKSGFSGADGTYRFGQLSPTTDYEIWAEAGGKKSKTKNISSFDTKNQFTIDLKL